MNVLKPAYVAPSGFRYYSEQQLHQVLGVKKAIVPKKSLAIVEYQVKTKR